MRAIRLLLLIVAGWIVWVTGSRPPLREPTRAFLEQPPRELPPCGEECGGERWDVKTLSDRDARLVHFVPVDATIERLALLERPVRRRAGRLGPVETTVYRVEGYLAGFDDLPDRERRLIVYGLEKPEVSIIAEVPDPACIGACRSGFAESFARIRASLDRHLSDTAPVSAHRVWRPVRVRITGVGFFDSDHTQIDAAPNRFELHPVLDLEFLQDEP